MTSPDPNMPVGPISVVPVIGNEFGVRKGNVWSWDTASGLTIAPPDYLAVPIDELVQMRRSDGQARALMRLMTLPIRASLRDSEWILPEGTEGGEEEVDFANAMWNLPPNAGGMTTPKMALLKQTLLAITDGVSVFEEVRQVPQTGPLAGKITIRKLAYRDPRTIKFLTDDSGGFEGVRQKTSVNGKEVDVILAKDKVIYYAANEEENQFYGVSFFEPAYKHYDLKRKLYYVAHVAAQLAAVPGRLGKIGANAANDVRKIGQFQEALSNFAFNFSMTYPDGWDVKEFNSNTSFDFLRLIDHHNMMMAASVLAKFMQMEDRQVLIDNGKADASADMFVLELEAIMQEIAEVWSNYLMPKYMDWNFGSGIYPVFKFGQLTDSARDTIKELFTTLSPAGNLNCTPEFLRETERKLALRLGYDIDYDAIAAREEQQAIMQEQLQAQQVEAQNATDEDPQSSSPTGTGDATVNGGVVSTSSVYTGLDALVALAAQAQEAIKAAEQEEPSAINDF